VTKIPPKKSEKSGWIYTLPSDFSDFSDFCATFGYWACLLWACTTAPFGRIRECHNATRDRNTPSMPPATSKRLPLPPRTSFDGRSPTSKYWGKKFKMIKMCPHVKPRGAPYYGNGLQCGLDADHCMCMCLLCGAPMRARRVCGSRLADGSKCMWGSNRSPDQSTPEASPERVAPLRPIVWWKSRAAPKPGPVPSVPRENLIILPRGMCLPNLEPGGPDSPIPGMKPRKRRETKVERYSRWLMSQSLWLTPTPSPDRGGSGS
jgi:hypothetical protein